MMKRAKIKGEFEMKKTKIINSALYIFLFALVFYIIRCAPMMADDYIFFWRNADTIKAAFSESLHYGNGRLIGNALTFFFVHYQTAMDIERTVCVSLLIILLPKIVVKSDSKKNFFYTVLSAVLVLGMCPLIFSGVISWASGCHNYVPPVLLSVICLLIVKSDEKNTFTKILSFVSLAVLGFASQLFLELSTLVQIVFVGFLIVFYFKTNKKKLPKVAVWFVSLIAGGALMFIIPKVFEPSGFADISTYREVHLGSVSEMISAVSRTTLDALYIFDKNEILFAFMAVLTLLMLRKYKDMWKSRVAFFIFNFVAYAALVFIMTSCVVNKYSVFTKLYIVNELTLVAAALALLLTFFVTALHVPSCKEKMLVIVCFIFAAVSVGPMLIVSPFSSRCMFMCYIFLSVAVIAILRYMLEDVPDEKIKKLTGVCTLVFVALSICLAVEFTDVYWLDTQQVNYVAAKAQEKPSEIEICNYDSSYINSGKLWALSYRYYNEEPFDIKFKETPFAEWYENRQAEGWF